MAKRQRGYILSDRGLQKLQAAKQAWEEERDRRCTQEVMQEASGLSTKTISKIFDRAGRADFSRIEDLFKMFDLDLQDEDLTREEDDRGNVGQELMEFALDFLSKSEFNESFSCDRVGQLASFMTNYREKILILEEKNCSLNIYIHYYFLKDDILIKLQYKILVKPQELESDSYSPTPTTLNSYIWISPSFEKQFLEQINPPYSYAFVKDDVKINGTVHLNEKLIPKSKFNLDEVSANGSYIALKKQIYFPDFYCASFDSKALLKEFLEIFSQRIMDYGFSFIDYAADIAFIREQNKRYG